MVLHYLGIPSEQAKIAGQLNVQPGVGAPAGRIRQLATDTVSVTYDSGDWETAQALLAQKIPVIAMIQAGELAPWRGESFQHAIVVIGCDEAQVWFLDPATTSDSIVTSIDEFMLAWSEMDYRYATITLSSKEM
jgi:hypothetical protein